MTRTLDIRAGKPVPLKSSSLFTKRAHIFEQGDLDALDAVLAAHRPLLVRGEPGTGKTQLAEAAAAALRCPLVIKTVDSRTESRDLLYEIDFVLRLAQAQLRGALGGDRDEAIRELALGRFVRPGALWWGFDWDKAAKLDLAEKRDTPPGWTPRDGCVVLLDEIDKAEPDLPNGLLEALGDGRFTDPEGKAIEVVGEPPLVIVTTNEERELPDAFVRRCFVHRLKLPKEREKFIAFAADRGAAHFAAIDKSVREHAAVLLFTAREARRDGGARPGLAEYLDVLRVVSKKGGIADEQCKRIDKVGEFTYTKFDTPRQETGAADSR